MWETLFWLAMGSTWGWYLRDMQKKRASENTEQKIGKATFQSIERCRFHKMMVGDGFDYVISHRVTAKNRPPVWIVVQTKEPAE